MGAYIANAAPCCENSSRLWPPWFLTKRECFGAELPKLRQYICRWQVHFFLRILKSKVGWAQCVVLWELQSIHQRARAGFPKERPYKQECTGP